MSLPNVEVLWKSTIQSIEGEKRVEGLYIQQEGQSASCRCRASSSILDARPIPVLGDELPLDEHGFIVTNEQMETALPLVYAAGDVRRKALRQVITAAADGP